MTGTESEGLSGCVTDYINNGLVTLKIKAEVSDYIVRKSAHVCEFLILGIILTIALKIYTGKVFNNICNALFVGLMTAVIDEFIQTFIAGRVGEVSDILIDFFGLAIGILITALIIKLSISKKRRKPRSRYTNKEI